MSWLKKMIGPILGIVGAVIGQPWLTAVGSAIGAAATSDSSSAAQIPVEAEIPNDPGPTSPIAPFGADLQLAGQVEPIQVPEYQGPDLSATGPAQTVNVTGQSLGSSAIQAAGALAAGGINYAGQQAANTANAKQAEQQMAFQNEMSSTAYQRAVADLQKAGLSPALAYSQGGASTPGGAMAQMGNALGPLATTALQAATTLQGLQNAKADMDLTDAKSDQVRSETSLNVLRDPLIRSQTRESTASAGALEQTARNAEETLKGIQLDNAYKANTLASRTGQEAAKSRGLGAEATISELGIQGAKSESTFAEKTGPLAPFVRLLQGIFGASHSARSAFGN